MIFFSCVSGPAIEAAARVLVAKQNRDADY